MGTVRPVLSGVHPVSSGAHLVLGGAHLVLGGVDFKFMKLCTIILVNTTMNWTEYNCRIARVSPKGKKLTSFFSNGSNIQTQWLAGRTALFTLNI